MVRRKSLAVPEDIGDKLDILLEEYEKQEGERMFVKGDDSSVSSIRGFITTGCDLLDLLMTYLDANEVPIGRGWAIGRWYEIFGPPSSNKSTTTHHLAAQVQKLNGYVVQLDTENATDDQRALRMGFDVKRCLRMRANCIEDAIEHIWRLFYAFDKRPELLEYPTAILLDSLMVLQTRKQFESGQINSGGMMEMPRQVKAGIRSLCAHVPKYNALMVMVNQTITSFKQYGGRTFTGTTTGGGDGPRFQHSVRLQLKEGPKYSDPYDEEMPQGKFVDFSTAKTKLFRPEGGVSIACDYMRGYNNAITNTTYLTDFSGDIKLERKRYFCPEAGIRKGLTYAELIEKAEQDTEFKEWLRAKVFENWRYVYASPPEPEKEKES